MQVSFWSNYHQTGTTCNLIATATNVALEYRMKVLIAHNHFDKSALETSFLDREYVEKELSNLNDVGVDALSNFIKFNKVSKENISRYTTTLISNKLELLVGTSITSRDLYLKELNDVIDVVLALSKEYYDVVFVDVGPGEPEIIKKIFDHSDLIVVNLNQNYNIILDFFENYSELAEKAVFMFGKYDKNSNFNIKSLQRKFRLLKGKSAIIPYNIHFADACCEGRAIDFFMRNLRAEKDDNNYYFMNEVRKAAQLILNSLNIDVNQKKLGD